MPAEVSLVREPYASNSLAKSSRHLISPSHPLTLYWFSVNSGTIPGAIGDILHGDDPPAQDDCKAHGPWCVFQPS